MTIKYSPLFNQMIQKKLVPYGVSLNDNTGTYRDAQEALGFTYTTRDNKFPPTPFLSSINPFNDDFLNAKEVLEIGGGVGRNLPFFMEHTKANYTTVDPNHEMTKHWWTIQPEEYKPRVTIYDAFDKLKSNVVFDIVIVTFVFQHIGYRPPFHQLNVADMTKEAMKHTRNGTVWFVLEHEREEIWQERWLKDIGVTPDVYYKCGGDHTGGGTIPYPEFESMTHRGNDNNLIIFKEKK